MSNNYVSMRIDTAKKHSVNHNVREHNDKSSMNQKEGVETPNFVLLNGEIKKIDKQLKTQLRKQLQRKMNLNRAEHNKRYYARRKRRIDVAKTHSTAEAVVFFSSSVNEKMRDGTMTAADILKTVSAMQKDFELLLDTKIHDGSIVLHMDEETPHVHFQFENFNKVGKSVLYEAKMKKKLGLLQDLVHHHFKKFGFDRGEKKNPEQDIRHVKTFDYKQKQLDKLEAEITSRNADNIVLEKQLLEHKEELESVKNKQTELRLLIKFEKEKREHLKSIEIDIEEKKKLYGEITQRQKIARENLKIVAQKMVYITQNIEELLGEIGKKNVELKSENDLLKEAIEHVNEELGVDVVDMYKTHVDNEQEQEQDFDSFSMSIPQIEIPKIEPSYKRKRR